MTLLEECEELAQEPEKEPWECHHCFAHTLKLEWDFLRIYCHHYCPKNNPEFSKKVREKVKKNATKIQG